MFICQTKRQLGPECTGTPEELQGEEVRRQAKCHKKGQNCKVNKIIKFNKGRG